MGNTRRGRLNPFATHIVPYLSWNRVAIVVVGYAVLALRFTWSQQPLREFLWILY